MYKLLQLSLLFLLLGLSQACTQQAAEPMPFSLCITDSPQPKGLLPESLELNSAGKLVMLSNRFNEDQTLYQKNFFIELSQQQRDSVYHLLSQLSDDALAQMETRESDSVVYKIALSRIVDKQRQSFLLQGSRFHPALMELIAYSHNLPVYKHHYKLKESHYFSTAEICTGKWPNHAKN